MSFFLQFDNEIRRIMRIITSFKTHNFVVTENPWVVREDGRKNTCKKIIPLKYAYYNFTVWLEKRTQSSIFSNSHLTRIIYITSHASFNLCLLLFTMLSLIRYLKQTYAPLLQYYVVTNNNILWYNSHLYYGILNFMHFFDKKNIILSTK